MLTIFTLLFASARGCKRQNQPITWMGTAYSVADADAAVGSTSKARSTADTAQLE